MVNAEWSPANQAVRGTRCLGYDEKGHALSESPPRRKRLDRRPAGAVRYREMAPDAALADSFGLLGELLDGRFRVESEIAEGGFGVVYRAIQIALDRPVALKILKVPPELDATARVAFREKFAAEAKTIARLRHPSIVEVHDFGIAQMPSGLVAPWMALEWLNGITLQALLEKRRGEGGQSPTQIFSQVRPILQAVAHAHQLGVVHRDIKPGNIMMTEADAIGSSRGTVLRILDFGIAKLMDREEQHPTDGRTRTGGIPMFSPGYAAPEQIAFGRTGPWTDVHALGLLITEMLTDRPPYGVPDMEIFEQVLAPERPTPAAFGRDVGAWEPVLVNA